MTWRYMLIQCKDERAEWVELHERFEMKEGVDRTAEPILVADDLAGILWQLGAMKSDIEKYGVEDDPCKEAKELT